MSSQGEYERQKKIAVTAIMIFGLISLFGDIIYEGARSAISTYLELLLAPAFIVGLAVGLGEFLGYALRFLSGYVADTTRAYWGLTIAGYVLLVSIPLLAFFVDWKVVIFLIVLERVAKAIRTPARDTLISVTTKAIGRGKAFGLHELMDQIGATVGPLIVTGAIWYKLQQGATKIAQLQFAFMILLIPYLILLVVLFSGYLRLKLPTQEALVGARASMHPEPLSRRFYLYSFAVMMNTAGLFQVALILYRATEIFIEILWIVPLLYLLIQGVDAIIAPISGMAYDKKGRSVLIVPFVLSVFPTIFIALPFIGVGGILMSPVVSVVLASAFYGIVLGMQESIYRAAVADLTGISKRGLGYGIFSTLYGFGFLISGAVLGYILDISKIDPTYMLYAVIYSIVLQIVAIILLYLSLRK